MNLTDSQLAQRGSEKLELAILSFFEQFRKMYVGDQAQKTSKVTHADSKPLFNDNSRFTQRCSRSKMLSSVRVPT